MIYLALRHKREKSNGKIFTKNGGDAMATYESEISYSEKWNWKFFDKVAGLDSKKIENCFRLRGMRR